MIRAMMRQPFLRVLPVLLACLNHGCVAPYRNEPLQRFDPSAGYRFDALDLGENNSDSLFICLTLSGGGTRAAAFAHGVLMGLRDTPIKSLTKPDSEARLLDEVDVISSVSGGSFTAMGYGLWRDGLFDGHFENRFLRHNVQGDLLRQVLNPVNWFLKPDSGELAASYYDEHIFRGRTYADLLERGSRPFVAINATDVARTEAFQFTQDNFDIMGSDLSQLPAAWAVATSSAFPVAIDPLRYKYFAGAAMESAVHETLARKDKRMLHPVKQSWARSLINQGAFEASGEVQIDHENHRYIYLSDGGVVDNLGVNYFYELFRTGAIRRRMEDGRIKRLALIIVDAGTDSPSDIEASSSTPGKLFVGLRSATSGVHTTTWLMTAVSQYVLLEAEPGIRKAYDQCEAVLREQCPQASVPERPAGSTVETYFIDVNFRRLQDRTERERLLALPTSFALEEEDVDALIEAGRNLVREHPELRRLLRDLQRNK